MYLRTSTESIAISDNHYDTSLHYIHTNSTRNRQHHHSQTTIADGDINELLERQYLYGGDDRFFPTDL
jgi:hypothetical protein